MSNAIITEKVGRNIIVTFNRPEIRSPLSLAVLDEIFKVLIKFKENETIIFTGKDDVFASGADLREIASVKNDRAQAFARRGQNLMNKIAERNAVAAINGFCFGGALDLALACKRRIASPNAEFSHPGANLGIITGWGGTQRLPRLVGEAKALEMFLTAKRVSAEEALRIGLIDEIAENPLFPALRK